MKKLPWLCIGLLVVSLVLLAALTLHDTPDSTVRHDTRSISTASPVQTTGSTPPVQSTTAATTTCTVNTDLNTATAADLMTVDGIGTQLAERILAYRDAHGGFSSVEALCAVDGIGNQLAARLLAVFRLPNAVTTAHATVTSTVPSRTTTPPASTTAPPAPPCLELNHVTAEELLAVPGMTTEIAQAVIAFREEIGGYQHPYELCLINGTTTDWWAKRIQYFYVEGCTDPVVTRPLQTKK